MIREGVEQNMKFCPKCECILRKKIEGVSSVLFCKNCGYKEILQEKIEIKRKIISDTVLPNSPKDVENSAEKNNEKTKKSLTPKKLPISTIKKTELVDTGSSRDNQSQENSLNKMEQELLLFEIKKNNLLKTLETYDNGPKEEEIVLEILNFLIRIQDLKNKRWQYLQVHGNPKEVEFLEIPKNFDDKNLEKNEINLLKEAEISKKIQTLIRSSRKTLMWISAIREEFMINHPEIRFKEEKYWGIVETAIEHWKLGYLLPLKNQIWIVSCAWDSEKQKVIPQVHTIDSEEKIGLAVAFLAKSLRILHSHFTAIFKE